MSQKILFLSRYSKLGASSRYRIYDYIDYLEKNGFECTVSPLFSDLYLTNRYSGKSIVYEFLRSYLKRVFILFEINKYDVFFIEKEIFPFVPFCIENFWLSRCQNYIVDYDDAIFHRYDSNERLLVRLLLSNKISQVMKNASRVIVGNQYLYDYAKVKLIDNASILPTVVDVDQYDKVVVKKNKQFTVVWIGSESTAHYIDQVKQTISKVCQMTNGKFVVIGANIHIPNTNVELVEWSLNTEKKYLKESHVGIMPLTDMQWDKGKCGFKIIQYMASKIQVVASPVGVNSDIIRHEENGYLASTADEWFECLMKVFNNLNNEKIINNGYKTVRERYSLECTAPIFYDTIKNVLRHNANIDHKVVKGFGREWGHFKNESHTNDLFMIWNDYFSIFPWNLLPNDGGIGADIGCGSGRWSYFVANKVKRIYLIDPSIEALGVAQSKLREFKNIDFINTGVEEAMEKIEPLDFAYSLGVLHHVPDIDLAFKSISRKLKKGAPFLVYLYYSFDNKPIWYRFIWKFSDIARGVVSKLPYKVKILVTYLIAFFVYYPISRLGLVLGKLKLSTSQFPLIYYSDKSFYFMKNDALDRFGTRLENRFSKIEILDLFQRHGFDNVEFSSSEPYWCACGIKK